MAYINARCDEINFEAPHHEDHIKCTVRFSVRDVEGTAIKLGYTNELVLYFTLSRDDLFFHVGKKYKLEVQEVDAFNEEDW